MKRVCCHPLGLLLALSSQRSTTRYSSSDESASALEGGGTILSEAGTAEGKDLKNVFYDAGRRRCMLCDEPVSNYHQHKGFTGHMIRMNVFQRFVSGKMGDPRDAPKLLWRNMQEPSVAARDRGTTFERIESLSHESELHRRRRLVHIIRVMFDVGILRESLGVLKRVTGGRQQAQPHLTTHVQLHRTHEFERFEMIGDNVLKHMLHDRLYHLFPNEQGGMGGTLLAMVQQLADSNDGLLRTFDYLRLDSIVGASLSNSKFKADLVEAMFGEMQVYLWATATRHGQEEHLMVDSKEEHALRALVTHTMNELCHVMLHFQTVAVARNMEHYIRKEYSPPVAAIHALLHEASIAEEEDQPLWRKRQHRKLMRLTPPVLRKPRPNPFRADSEGRAPVVPLSDFTSNGPVSPKLKSLSLRESRLRPIYQAVKSLDEYRRFVDTRSELEAAADGWPVFDPVDWSGRVNEEIDSMLGGVSGKPPQIGLQLHGRPMVSSDGQRGADEIVVDTSMLEVELSASPQV